MVTSYLRAVWRRWYLLAAVLLVTLGTLVLALHESITVASRVVVPFSTGQGVSDFQGIAQSLTVARAVEFDLRINDETAERLLQQVAVTRESGSDIYDIIVHDTSRARAVRICDAWVTEADALFTKLDTAPAALAYSAAVQQLSTTQQQINTLQQQIIAFEYAHPDLVNVPVTSITSTPAPSSRRSDTTVTQITNHTPGNVQNALYLANLQQQLTGDQTMYAQLSQAVGATQSQALASMRLTSAQVLDPAALVPANVPLLTTLAVLLGLLLGLGLVAVWDHFDHAVRGSAPLERAFGARAVVTVAARPGARELRRVAPVDWARPALPAATSRAGRWPVGTYVLAALAAARPHFPSQPSADSAALAAHNGHLNGHQNGHYAVNTAQADGSEDHNTRDGYDHDGPRDAAEEPASDGPMP